MAKIEFTKEQLGLVYEALGGYGSDVKKLMGKADKLGLVKETESLKNRFLEIEAIRNKIEQE